MKKDHREILAIFLIILGFAFLAVIEIYFFQRITAKKPTGLGQELLGGTVALTSLASIVIGLILLFKNDKDQMIKANTYSKKTEVDHPRNVVLGTQYQTIYEGVIPSQVDEEEYHAAFAILRQLPERKIPAPAHPPIGSRLPDIPHNRLFVGREQDLRELAVWFKGESPVALGRVAAVTGMDGIGKTQLVSEIAHRYGQYFAGGVFWLNFAYPDLIPLEVAACGNPAHDRPLENRVKQVLAEWQSELPRLLIFDNCEAAELLVQWLPPMGGSRVLVTNRQNRWDPGLGVERPLGLLKRPESIALLKGFREDLRADDPYLNEIAGELGDLPLALHMAGSYLYTYRPDLSPRWYLEELRRPGVLKHRSVKDGESLPIGHDLSIERTFEIGVERLRLKSNTDRLVLDLLKRIACFAPGELIPREVLKASVGEDVDVLAFGGGMNRLLGLGLVEGNKAGDVRMHRLVVCFVLEAFPDEAALIEVEEAVQNAAARANQSGYPARMQPVLVHLKHLTDQALKRGDGQAAGLANRLGYYLNTIKDYTGTRTYLEQALAIRRKALGDKHPDTAVSFNNLGSLLQAMGDYSDARPYYEQALAINMRVLGKEHPSTALSLNNLGALLRGMGDYAGARPYCEQALAIRRKVFGEAHLDTAFSLNNLGYLLNEMGDYAGARPYFEQALAIFETVLGVDHPNTRTVRENLEGLKKEMEVEEKSSKLTSQQA